MTTQEIEQQHQTMVSEINSVTKIDDKTIQPLTFQIEDNIETQSYATADSQDPTHENYENEIREDSPPRPSQDSYPFSPPVPDFPDEAQRFTNPTPDQAHSDNAILSTSQHDTMTLNSQSDPATTVPWQVASASKRKAKSSPEPTPNTSPILKVTNSSLIHNYLLKARDPATGAAGRKK
jgi:hypothetical protein